MNKPTERIGASVENISVTRNMVKRRCGSMRSMFIIGLPLIFSLIGPAKGDSMSQLSVANQSVTVPNSAVVPINFDPQGDSVAGLQFDFPIPPGTTFQSASIGAAATAAQKSLSSNVIGSSVRVLVFGLNQTTIAAGVIADINLGTTAPGTEPFALNNASASDPTGTAVPITTQAGTLILTGGTMPTSQSAFDTILAQLGTVVTNEDSVISTGLTAIAAAIAKLASALPPGAPADLTTEAANAQAMITDITTQTASLSTAVANLQSGTSSAAS